MPLYAYRCPTCLARKEVFKSLAQLDNIELCPHCAQPMVRALTAARIVPDYPGYSCPITGKWIEGRRAHNENLAQHGCRVLEAGEKEAAERYRQAVDQEFDQKIEKTAEELVAALPPAKLEQLACELDKGIDVQVVRA